MELEHGALDAVRIVDLTDERASYGVKLLAELGASVVRPILKEGDPLASRGPFDKSSGDSLWYAFYASSRKFFELAGNDEDSIQLQTLCENADIVVYCDNNHLDSLLDLQAARKNNEKLVLIECSSFGEDGPWKDFLAPDLVAGALGGSVNITGDADTTPLKPFGELNFSVAGAYVAIAALAALRHVRQTGKGQVVHVSVHECIASCLEHVFMWYLHHEQMPNSRAPALERRGSLHWTNLYHVMSAKDGHIMVTPTPSFDRQLAWLIEEDAFEDLLDPKYQEPEHRREWMVRMMDVLRSWVATQEVESLFFRAQEHHAPYGWVQKIDQVAQNPQLEARNWWRELKHRDTSLKTTGSPYHHGDTPARPKPSEWIVPSTEDILDLCGWGSPP